MKKMQLMDFTIAATRINNRNDCRWSYCISNILN